MDRNLERKRYTRREALRVGGGFALGAIVLGAVACDDGEQGRGSVGSGSSDEPQRGGVLQFSSEWFYPADSMDPGTISENGEIVIAGMLYQGLTSLDYDWAAEPVLAESWENNADFTEWTFNLREAKFHDGTDFTAEDAAYSIGRLVDKDFGSALFARLSPSLSPDGIQVVDDRTLKLELKRPDSLILLPLSAYQAFVVKEGSEKDGVGTGPFKVRTFNAGRNYEFERFEDYWRDGYPYLDGVRIVATPEEAPKVQAVTSGQAHLSDMNYVSVDTVEASSAEILESDPVHLYNVAMDVTQAPFDDVRVRQAMKFGLDREKVLEVAYSGFSEVAHDIPAPDSDPFVPEDLAGRERDVEEAKRLLSEAGHPDGLDLKLECSSDELQTNFALGYADALKDAGFNIEVEPYPAETYWDDVWLQKPFYVSEWFRRHPVEAMSVMLASDAPWNESKFKNDELDSLLEQVLEVSEDEQQDLISKALSIVAEESGLGIPGFRRRLFAAKPELKGLEFTTFTVISFEGVSLG
jgi:peptide/nickel transport system substrate-binding protein